MQVLFVHGMGRSPLSGWPLLIQLRRGGLITSSFGYFTAFESFDEIKKRLVSKMAKLASDGEYVVIGHSLGGVLLRAAIDSLPIKTNKPCHLFLLASPVIPSRIAIKLGSNLIFRAITGDCGQLLGSYSRMSAIPPTSVPKTSIVGVRALPFKTFFSPEEVNDGVVSLSEVSAEWINEQVQVNSVHSFISSNKQVGEIVLEKVTSILKINSSGSSNGST
jgi:hypothetical protein